MKKLIFILLIIIPTFAFSNLAESSKNYSEIEKKSGQEITIEQTIQPYNPLSFLETQSEWNAFWITLLIAAIGAYTIYGIAAGLVAAALVYFITNGNKKAFKLSILAWFIGIALGLGIWFAIH